MQIIVSRSCMEAYCIFLCIICCQMIPLRIWGMCGAFSCNSIKCLASRIDTGVWSWPCSQQRAGANSRALLQRFGPLGMSSTLCGRPIGIHFLICTRRLSFAFAWAVTWRTYSTCTQPSLLCQVGFLINASVMSYSPLSYMIYLVSYSTCSLLLNNNTFTATASEDLIGTGFMHFRVFWALREHFRIDCKQLFQLTPKAHQCMHCCLLSNIMNPRRTWCYGHEDFMGKMRTLGLSASKGSYGPQVSKRMLEKWAIAMHLLLLDPKGLFWRK